MKAIAAVAILIGVTAMGTGFAYYSSWPASENPISPLVGGSLTMLIGLGLTGMAVYALVREGGRV